MRLSAIIGILVIASGCQLIAGIGERSEGARTDGGTDGGATTGGTGGMDTGGAATGGAGTGGEMASGGSGGMPAATCILNSDCEDGLVCIFATCSVPCRNDADCDRGFRCLETSAGTACVDSATTCGDGCPGGTACIDGACRVPCGSAPAPEAGVEAGVEGGLEAGTDAAITDAAIPDARALDSAANDASTGCRADQVCVNGGCVGTGESPADGGTDAATPECEPDTRECLDNVARVCGPDGRWTTEECPLLCVQGVCKTDCDEGEKQCNDNVPQTCNAGGTWDDGDPCPNACHKGECTACKPPDKQCAAGNVPQTCSDSGAWVSGAVCQYVCDASLGECGGVCSPGDQRCFANSVQTCNANGQWTTTTACAAGVSQCDAATFTCKRFTGQSCTVREQCQSNFCRDGYCCEEACTGTCRSCGLAGSAGTCLPVLNAPDADSCTGAQACSGSGICKLADGQQCDTNSDCANSNCTTFYADADQDGYGNGSNTTKLCQLTPPSGYVANNTDCCDSDARARPGGVPNGGNYLNNSYGWYETLNNCGSGDYDCSGTTQKASSSLYNQICNANCSNWYCFPADAPCGTAMVYQGGSGSCEVYSTTLVYCK